MINPIRRLHLYLGVFFAPSIIFFAFSGALQTWGLHENRSENSYTPPAWIVMLANVHKDQQLHVDHPQKHPMMPRPIKLSDRPTARPHSAGFKWFVLFMAIALITTTGLGIYLSFAYNRNKLMVWGLLLTGIVLPILLLIF